MIGVDIIAAGDEGQALSTSARVFDSPESPADLATIAVLERGVRDADLAAPPVVLPDFHHKSNMEMPSSIAVATRETIRPTLTSASLNCGMALIALPMERPSGAAIATFYQRVKTRYPFPPRHRLELTGRDVLRCAEEGGWFAVDRCGIDPAELDRVEAQSRLDLEPYGGAQRLRRELPWLVVQLARLRFGTVGPSNHFVELQEVEEILDPVVASRLGVHQGQVTLQYHAGGGALTGELGALFGRRKHSSLALQLVRATQRPIYHLASARSLAELRQRFSLYFSRDCPAVPINGDEGRRLMLANAAAMNYGFAFRLATYASLGALAREAFGGDGPQLVVDSPHNSIYEEEVRGAPAVVHRHNSCRAFPASKMVGHPVFADTGQPVLLPGSHRTSSYLCVAAEGSARSLHSACHGAGSTITQFAQRGLSGLDPSGHTTVRYDYAHAEPETVRHLDDRGVDAALAILVRNNLVRPVARLRPFAVLN